MKKWGILFALSLAACGQSAGESYTLYRHSFTATSRIHIATFDADESGEYNQENCQIAAELFANQPGVTVRYWCEKGRFRL